MVAMIVAVPGATAVTVNVALDDPPWIVTVPGTVATAGLLLDRAMFTLPVCGALSETVPCVVAPAGTLEAPRTTFIVEFGFVGEVELPH
ncbi:MAG: hypothetical protein DMG04_24275 [Acidobacteria bacterium]|nr:MAG: hypothetical protein DMG04_24275 [Acidobacteriota bacterium]PYQ86742.1 MAG: hypothetical protein DMG02_23905 [Acidobacteriota bacterium]PYR11545.1 MAG: hypothetical protein DMF99_07795 [Acidobacteriota bacterium]